MDVTMRDSNSKEDPNIEIHKPAILKSSACSKKMADQIMNEETKGVRPFTIDPNDKETAVAQIQNEMDIRRKNYLKNYKTKLDLNDILELRNP